MVSRTPASPAASNRAVFADYREAMLGKRPLDEVIAPDIVMHLPEGDALRGSEAFKHEMEALLRAFPDQDIVIEDIVSDGDRLAARLVFDSGPHSGAELWGLSAETKGRSFRMGEILIVRIEDGRVAEQWFQADVIGMMQQIGAQADLTTASG